MIDFNEKMLTGAVCWLIDNTYIIVPRDEFFDFVMITTESILETRRVLYVKSEQNNYAVLMHNDGRALAFPEDSKYLEMYNYSIWSKSTETQLEQALLVRDPTR